MKHDIISREDVVLLVNSFYYKVQESPVLGFIFNDIAKLNWDEHLPRMYSFWASALFNELSFTGNPMRKHIALSRLTSMTDVQFNEWLTLFYQTVDEHFEGSKADEAKARAANIARNFQRNIQATSMEDERKKIKD
jgi:hemoglobin